MRNFKVSSVWLSGLAFLVSAMIVPSGIVIAQEDDDDELLEEITVTGTRITNQNVTAASPVMSLGQDELSLKQTTSIERIFRDLPITIPGDGENVNNGTDGQSTIDLRGLGDGRSLILMNGKRLSPYDIAGEDGSPHRRNDRLASVGSRSRPRTMSTCGFRPRSSRDG